MLHRLAMIAPAISIRPFLQRRGAALVTAAYALLFLLFFQDMAQDSGDLAAAAMAFGTAPAPGYALLHALAPLSLLAPFGPPGIGLVLLNGIFMGIAIHQFARLCAFLLEDPLSALIPPAGLMAGLLFFRGTFLFSPIPLTFLCVTLMLRLLQWPLADPRRLWAAAFVMGLGFVGVHPVFRLLLAPFSLYVLWMFPSQRRAVLAAPVFGIAGAAVAVLLPLAAHRFHPALADPSTWSGFLDTLFTRPELAAAGPRAGSVHAFVWWPEALAQLERLGESFPVELLPLVAVGLWPQKNHTPFLVLLGLGLAEWVWAVWMAPGQDLPSGWLLSAALWVAFARGVQWTAGRFVPPAGTAFTLFFLVLGPLAAWFSDGGERFHLQPAPAVAEWETLAALPETGGIWVLEPESWARVQGRTASLPRSRALELKARIDAGNIPADAFVAPCPQMHIEPGRCLVPVAPLAGHLVECGTRPVPAPETADHLARGLLAAARDQPSFARRLTAKQLAAWGLVLLHGGQPMAASRMARFARLVLPELEWNHLLQARIERFWGRPENARLLLRRALATSGSEPAFHRELAETDRELARLERTPQSLRHQLLQEALQMARRARILAPRDPEMARLVSELEPETAGLAPPPP